LTAETGKR